MHFSTLALIAAVAIIAGVLTTVLAHRKPRLAGWILLHAVLLLDLALELLRVVVDEAKTKGK